METAVSTIVLNEPNRAEILKFMENSHISVKKENNVISIQIVTAKLDQPKRTRVDGYSNAKTKWFKPDEFLDFLEEFYFNRGFKHDYHFGFLNNRFPLVIGYNDKSKGGFLFCDANLFSYSKELLDERILYSSEFNELVTAGKKNAEKLAR